jgi:hypothetical protein
MVAPPSDDPRRLREFPEQLVDCLVALTQKGVKPRDIVSTAALRNALTVAIAMGGSTNVALHSVEIARAAGIDLWKDVISQREFNALSHRVPVLINARPFGLYSMVDIDAKGGLEVIVKQLLDAGLLDGSCVTCTGETLAEQVGRLDPPEPDHEVIHSIAQPFKETGAAPPARQPRARGRCDSQDRRRGRGQGTASYRRARPFTQRQDSSPRPRRRDCLQTHMVVIHEAGVARPVCRFDPTGGSPRRRQKNITIAS